MRFGIPDVTPQTAADRAAFPAQSSVLDEQALLHRVLPLYDLPTAARSCRFFTRADSDIYRIETDDGVAYLKIRRPPIDKARCEAEAQLLYALGAQNIPVVRAIRLKRGGY